VTASSSISSEPPAPFQPDEDQVALLFEALSSPSLSLQQVAVQFNTTVEALSIYITAPRGSEALDTLDSALFTRLRLIALSTLPSVIASLAAIVREHSQFEATKPAEQCARFAERTSEPDPFSGFKLLERKRINARKAGSLLFRLATLHPREPRIAPRPQPHIASPSLIPPRSTPPRQPSQPSKPSRASDLLPLDPLDPVDRFSTPSFLRARAGAPPQPSSMPTRPLAHASAAVSTSPSRSVKVQGSGARSLIERAGQSTSPAAFLARGEPHGPAAARATEIDAEPSISVCLLQAGDPPNASPGALTSGP